MTIADDRLRFHFGNSKLDPRIATFSLPSGWTCPGADTCLARVHETDEGLRLEDGPNTQVRCFWASTEVRFKEVHDCDWHNWNLLRRCKGAAGMADLIERSLP